MIADPHHQPYATHPMRSWRLPWVGSPRRWTAALAWLRGMRDIDLGGPVDVVVSFELFSVGTRQAARLSRRLGAAHVVQVAEILDSNPLYRIPPWRGNARRSVRSVDGVICLTSAAARHVVNLGVPHDRVVVIPPGLDTSVFHPLRTVTERPSVAISVGELRPDKGVLRVIAAADRVSERLSDEFRLVLVGDGPLREEVERAARSRPWLVVRGRLPRAQVAEELRAAGAFVLAPHARPFSAEQLCFAMLEAMACGLPVVVTDCGALSEVAPPHNRVVAEGDINALAEGLIEALGPDGQDWGRRNVSVIEDRYTLERQAERLGDELTAMLVRSKA